MTESGVFNILLENEKTSEYKFDFPKQQLTTIQKVSKNLTDIIYESYKCKSSASTSKRHQILVNSKFINTICEVPQPHVYEDYMKCCLKQVKQKFTFNKKEVCNTILKDISLDINQYKENRFQANIDRYWNHKIVREKEKQKQIAFINDRNQHKLNMKCGLEVKTRYSYISNENLLQKLLGTRKVNLLYNDQFSNNLNETNRNIEVKLAYTMLNVGENDLLNKILEKLTKYDGLNNSEINFLRYLWSIKFDQILNTAEFIPLFYFLLEEIIIKHSTNLLDIKQDDDVGLYFEDLNNNTDITKIKNICKIDYNIYLKLNSLIYELYFISFCNENLLKLCEIIT